LAYFSIDSSQCATCAHWLGGRKIENPNEGQVFVDVFQNLGHCVEKQVEREVKDICDEFTLWSALPR
jgi:hypothetical protein